MIAEILSGLFSGVISGMGIGGGTILIPALTMFLSVDQHRAQGVNLLFFIPTAIIALITHKKHGNLDFKIAKPLILTGLIGAAIGSFVANSIDAQLLKRLFGFFLFAMGSYEIYKGFKK